MLCGPLSSGNVSLALDVARTEPDKWEVYLVKVGAKDRSLAQNRLFRRLLRRFAQQLGHSVQYWHDYLVERFLGFDEVMTEDGYVRKVLCSTGDLKMEDFSRFLSACLVVAAENQVDLD